jgi:hypothetical protein
MKQFLNVEVSQWNLNSLKISYGNYYTIVPLFQGHLFSNEKVSCLKGWPLLRRDSVLEFYFLMRLGLLRGVTLSEGDYYKRGNSIRGGLL